MATYSASPWGEIRGKLGKSIGTKWKGKNVVRAWTMPKNPKTIRQTNQRMAALAVLGHIVKENLLILIYPIWEKICKKKRLQQTGTSLFMQANISRLYNSIPDKSKPVDKNNFPDYTKILISTGNLEPTSSISANLSSNYSKSLSIKWNPHTYQNGTPDDEVHIAIFQKPSNKKPFGKLICVNPRSHPRKSAYPKRSDAEVTINFGNTGILPVHFIYIFFYNKNIGYSPSKSVQIKPLTNQLIN